MILGLALALALAACAAKPVTMAFRAADAPIWSAAAFQPASIAGTWRQVASFQDAGSQCGGGAVEIAPVAGGVQIDGTLCLAGQTQSVSGLARPSGPGRLVVGGEEWWVLWVDTDYRTMAVGTPSGRFGFVLDRGAIPRDRLEATREIFDFNGYRTDALTAL
ncbi:MAG: lipocalin family protein [Tabrizicola sp.]|jgi:apolipoprotein D and lipocalin family protein|nr:lipocalin family protein [Tabrizicola sp.]